MKVMLAGGRTGQCSKQGVFAAARTDDKDPHERDSIATLGEYEHCFHEDP